MEERPKTETEATTEKETQRETHTDTCNPMEERPNTENMVHPATSCLTALGCVTKADTLF
jgi:hypothetical protein